MAAVTDRNKTTRFQPVHTDSWLEPCSFIPEVSHAIIIKQRNRNLCDTGSVRKSRKINGFTTTFRLHNGYNPSIEFIIIGQSRHEKDLAFSRTERPRYCIKQDYTTIIRTRLAFSTSTSSGRNSRSVTTPV